MTDSSIRYPDNGNQLEDASMLRNAVRFMTGQRAFAAYRLLNQPFHALKEETLGFLAVDAFVAEMTSTEDVLGWLLVLKDWKPGTAEASLFILLDAVRVGPATEEAAKKLLDAMDGDALRHFLHLPSNPELEAAGFADVAVREAMAASIEVNLGGLRRLVELRQSENRGRVVAFNKLKRMLLALPVAGERKHSVLIPKVVKFDATGIHRQSVTLEASQQNVELMSSRAIVAQAVLNSLLGMILWTRFGEAYETPDWAIKALDLPGWYKGVPTSAP